MKNKKMSDEEIKSLSFKDLTNLLLEEKGSRNTLDLFTEIVKLQELPQSALETKIGDYYTSLTTDKRFVLLEDGSWDLRSRHTSDKAVIKVEMDEEDIEEDEKIDLDEEETLEDDYEDESEDSYDDETEDDLKDLVVIDEDEIE